MRDLYGWFRPEVDTAGMTFPVQCAHCRGVYDIGKVTVTARYLDCSVWRSPCCNAAVDDRKPPWTHMAHYTEIRQGG